MGQSRLWFNVKPALMEKVLAKYAAIHKTLLVSNAGVVRHVLKLYLAHY